jgi:hypothetical protein
MIVLFVEIRPLGEESRFEVFLGEKGRMEKWEPREDVFK